MWQTIYIQGNLFGIIKDYMQYVTISFVFGGLKILKGREH